MIIHNLEDTNSVLNSFISEIRDHDIQKNMMRFRRNIERIGEVIAYELSRSLNYTTETITTPLGDRKINLPQKDIVLCSILRAGLPLHNGLLNYFDNAENAFISAYRKPLSNENEFEIEVEYLASPLIADKTLILADPMLATGKSLVAVLKAIEKFGTPKVIHIVSVIASKSGIEFIERFFPENTNLWVASIDNQLNSKGYIIPGLGDAGDLAYGKKL